MILLFNSVLDQHAPVKTIKVRGRPNPCVTDNILRTRENEKQMAPEEEKEVERKSSIILLLF